MRYFIIFILLISFSSCLKTEELNTDKFENITITPTLLLPFTQIDLSNKYYQEIFENPTENKVEVEMEVELFEKNDISNEATKMEFYFTSFNGFPMDFENIEIQFLDENKNIINSIPLKHIVKAPLKPDGSLENIIPNKHDVVIFLDNDIKSLMNTRAIKVVLSWLNNPIQATDVSYYFKINSYVILTTNIEL